MKTITSVPSILFSLSFALLGILITGLGESKGGDTVPKYERAVFAAGCFWGVEDVFSSVKGVVKTTAGYTGGHTKNPAYEDVCSHTTGHVEAVEVLYDPKIVSYEKLLDVFFRMHDPTTLNKQGPDVGNQYRSAIFYTGSKQKAAAEKMIKKLEEAREFKSKIVTEVTPAVEFYRAEEYHQQYFKKNNKSGCHILRGEFKNTDKPDVKGDKEYKRPSNEEIKKKLSALQCEVTQGDGTEQPFHNEYWDNKKEGIYVDIVSGEPLFSSTDKYDSGTGWPSFTKPLEKNNITEKLDKSLKETRTEVRSTHGNSHLGHVFNDGPKPTGLRFCINSAALRFIPKENLEKEGYKEYLKLFLKNPKK